MNGNIHLPPVIIDHNWSVKEFNDPFVWFQMREFCNVFLHLLSTYHKNVKTAYIIYFQPYKDHIFHKAFYVILKSYFLTHLEGP